jgi:hypothetical protein
MSRVQFIASLATRFVLRYSAMTEIRSKKYIFIVCIFLKIYKLWNMKEKIMYVHHSSKSTCGMFLVQNYDFSPN